MIAFGICGPAEPTRGATPPLEYIGLLIGAMPGLIIGPVRGLGCWRMAGGVCIRARTQSTTFFAGHFPPHEWHGSAHTWYSAVCAID